MSHPSFSVAVENRYFEDYIPGEVHAFGRITADGKEMTAFARRFDPQPFHTDPEAARGSIYGGLIASGWYTASLMMRLLVDHYLPRANLGSPGIDELRWRKPVRPGDVLSLRVTVLEAHRSRSKPDRGMVHSSVEVLNQEPEVVMTLKIMNLVRCRNQSPVP